MTMFTPASGWDSGGGFGYNLAAADRIYTGAMTGLYGWTALGLGVAGTVAWLLNAAGIYVGLSLMGMIVGLVLAIGCLFGMQYAARKGAPLAVVGGLYLLFTAIAGALLSYVFAVFTSANITAAFAGACGLFALMSVFGFTTKKDLSKLGTLAFIALIGMIVVGLLNAFLFQSSGLQTAGQRHCPAGVYGLDGVANAGGETGSPRSGPGRGSGRRRAHCPDWGGRDVPEYRQYVSGSAAYLFLFRG